jgi:flagellar assembly protein FliH
MPGGSVTVVPDSSVEIGGCIVEAGNRTIDAQLGPALERLREVLS